MKANYHTHLLLCGHAEGMSEDYVKKAIECGFEILGMSDHGPIKPEFMSKEEFIHHWLERQMTYEEFLNIYLPDCRNTKEKYKDFIRFFIGVEIEYLPPFHSYFVKIRNELDYMNLGLHFYYHDGKLLNSYEDVTYENLYSYGINASLAMETGLYSIMTHPDLFMYDYKSKDGTDTFDEVCERTARLIIESSIKNNVYLEINVGGIFKALSKNAEVGKSIYPRDEFWKIVSQYPEAKVVIGVDAHKLKDLAANEIELAYEFAKKHNIKVFETVESIG